MTSTQRETLRSILSDSIRDYAAQTELRIEFTEETRLLGPDAPLDSLGLVTVLASFEAGINDRFDAEIVLADERAMSMEHSPFRTMGSLIDYACTLLDENGKSA